LYLVEATVTQDPGLRSFTVRSNRSSNNTESVSLTPTFGLRGKGDTDKEPYANEPTILFGWEPRGPCI